MSRRIWILLLTGVGMLSLASFGAAETYTVRADVSDGVLNMRTGPGVGHPLVTAVPAGSTGITLGDCQTPDDGKSQSKWCVARWGTHSGWISTCCIFPVAAPASPSVPPK